jgi:hypothetical protein
VLGKIPDRPRAGLNREGNAAEPKYAEPLAQAFADKAESTAMEEDEESDEEMTEEEKWLLTKTWEDPLNRGDKTAPWSVNSQFPN